MIVKYSSEELQMNYSEEEISEIIREYMRENEFFSFKGICSYIFDKANQEDRIKKEKDTEYRGGVKISYFDEIIVSQILWEEIWNKRLFINFSKNPYFVQTNEIQFVVRNNG